MTRTPRTPRNTRPLAVRPALAVRLVSYVRRAVPVNAAIYPNLTALLADQPDAIITLDARRNLDLINPVVVSTTTYCDMLSLVRHYLVIEIFDDRDNPVPFVRLVRLPSND